MKDSYDVIVVGAGPAGSIAAKTAAEKGYSVLLIEKRQEIGEPIRCAEGIAVKGLADFTEPDPKWICAKIRRTKMFSPSGSCLEFREENCDVAYILDRKLFDRDLAKKAAHAGAEVYTKTQATGVLIENGQVTGIRGKQLGDDFEAKARVVIAADGVESRVARWAGLNTTIRRADIGSCAQYHLVHPGLEKDCFEFHFGRKHAPGGYAWVFPKGDGEANVGLGVSMSGPGFDNALTCLKKFVAWRFPGASVLQTMAGGVTITGMPPRLSSGGIVLVGDAGRLSDPATGEGILNGMISGRLAASVVARAISAGDVSAGALRQYDAEVSKCLGPVLDRNYRLKNFLLKASDARVDLAFRAARAMNVDRISTSRLAEEVFSSSTGGGILKLFLR
jgi:digeranylgeranylglycerophospholipid reductase